jgi:hypothetical protein
MRDDPNWAYNVAAWSALHCLAETVDLDGTCKADSGCCLEHGRVVCGSLPGATSFKKPLTFVETAALERIAGQMEALAASIRDALRRFPPVGGLSA